MIEYKADGYLDVMPYTASSGPWTAVDPDRQERRVVAYLGDPVTALAPLFDALRDAGWSVRHIAPDAGIEALRASEAVIGIVDFAQCAPTRLVRQVMGELAAQMRWVALLDEQESDPELLGLVGQYCHDFHRMPVDAERLLHTLGHAWGMGVLTHIHGPETEVELMSERDMVGMSAPMLQLFGDIRKISHTDCSVLVRGETGTGKELCALALHAHSSRANGPFVAINCGALPPELIQSELFGHEKGAFTGAHQRKQGLIETAAGGSLFLDEIGDLPVGLQVHLLRFLQEGQFTRVGGTQTVSADVRIIAATHVDLEQAVAEGRFRQDLMFRLNVIPLYVPPLRERPGDPALLARYFLQRFRHESRRQIQGFSEDALQALDQHDWPGNVRELINRVHRAVVMCDHKLIRPADMGLRARISGSVPTLDDAREKAEREAVHLALSQTGNNVSEAAKLLGVSRATLYRLLQRLGLAPTEYSSG
ncbi:sigma-54 dependent transcriptional regulator [Acidihalobacter prosperus]|uniref:Sigma-54-dependent Fis family transcriptional regulator n=1 Tax=Acidihalobacter prosperus TaxID=160660 RepID=A0A1A6C0M1_9GAMM|nr:sigma-54 dependent transcriptional regulator [Acidihalobacter prosperus]OBS08105.1 sigma-54-dependent Fis family transcriptional regulator [Acidihalobacter prosperus]